MINNLFIQSALILGLIFSWSGIQAQNDVCADAVTISCGQSVPGSTVGASIDDLEATPCGSGAISAPGVWYAFAGTGDLITVSTCGATNFDSKLSVYEGSCGNLVCVSGNDDFPGCAGNSSETSFLSASGTQYYILVHAWASGSGDFDLTLTCASPCSPVPSNDDCANASPLTIPSSGSCVIESGTNACASASTSNPSCDPFGSIVDVWYTFNSGTLTALEVNISPVTAGFVRAAVYDACAGLEITCLASGSGTLENLTPGTDYYLQVWNSGSADEGTFDICIQAPPSCPAPSGLSAGASTESQAEITWSSANSGSVYFFEYGAPGFSQGSGLGTLNGISQSGQNSVVVNGLASETDFEGYLLEVCSTGDTSSVAGPVTFSTSAPTAGNDACINANLLTCGMTVNDSTTAATLDIAPDCNPAPVNSPGVWYAVEGTGFTINVSVCNAADFDSKISVYEGACDQLNCVVANDDSQICGGATSELGFLSTQGTMYYILVHGWFSGTGSFALTVSCDSTCALPPANDLCSLAEPLTVDTLGSCNATSGSNACATAASSNPSCNNYGTIQDVWYSFNSGNSTFIQLDLISNSGAGFNIAVYDDCGGGLVLCQTNVSNTLLTNLSTNTEYKLQIWNGGVSAAGSFDLCLYVPQPPANSQCSQAIDIFCGNVISGTTNLASIDSIAACNGISNTSPGVWYSFMGTGDSTTISTCGTATFDSKLSIFEGECGALTCLTANDDTPGCSGLTSELGFNAISGQLYYILVHGYASQSGDFDLSIECVNTCPDIPANDNCGTAQTLPLFAANQCVPVMSSNICASSSLTNPSCGVLGQVHDVWYTFNTGLNDKVIFSLYPTTGGPYSAALYDSCGGMEIMCLTDIGSDTLWNLTENTEYTLQLWSADAEGEGDFGLCMNEVYPDCSVPSSIALSSTFTSFTVEWTSQNPDAVYFLEWGPAGFTPGSGTAILSDNVDPSLMNTVSVTNIPASSDYEVYLYESCYWGETTDLVGPLSVSTPTPLVANDICAGAVEIQCGETLMGSTTDATIDTDISSDCGPALVTGPGVWYSFIGTGDQITLSNCNSAFDTQLGVYTGDCSGMNCVIGNDIGTSCTGFSAEVVFNSVLGQEYFILITGYQNQVGDFQLSMSCDPVCQAIPANNTCSSPVSVTVNEDGVCTSVIGDNTCATNDMNNTSCDPYGAMHDVWFTFNSGNLSSVKIKLTPLTASNLEFAVYPACGGPEWDCIGGNVDHIHGLLPNTDYILQIGNGGGPEAGTFEICIGPSPVTCNDPYELAASNVDFDSADLSWMSDNSNSQYVVEWGLLGFVPGSGSGSFMGNNMLGQNMVSVSGLEESTLYDFYVTEECDDNLYAIGGPFAFSTNSSTCPNPASFNVVAVDSFSAQVSWISANSGADFVMEWGPDGFTPGNGIASGTGASLTANTYEITGLDQLTIYNVYLYEICAEDDQSGLVGPISFTTLGPYVLNDVCGFAESIACGQSLSGSTSASSLDVVSDCGSAMITSPGVWYVFEGNGDRITLSTCSFATFDTKLAVYTGDCGDLSCFAGNDDGVDCSSFRSSVTFNSEIGEMYYVLVSGYQNEVGSFTLEASCEAGCVSPLNDDCQEAEELTVQETGSCQFTIADNSCANSAVDNPGCDLFTSVQDVWYMFNTGPLEEVNLDFSLGTAQLASFALYSDCGGTELICAINAPQSPLSFSALMPNTTYYLQVWNGGASLSGTVNLCINGMVPCPAPEDLDATVLSDMEAELSWMSENPGATFTAEWGPAGFDPGQGIGSATGLSLSGENSLIAIGLSPSTTYDFYVVEDCGGGEVSEVEGPFSFTTDNVDLDALNALNWEVSVYPNPAKDQFNIGFDVGNIAQLNIQVYNTLGELVHSESYSEVSGKFVKPIQLQNPAAGIYFVDIIMEDIKITKKLVIQ